MSLSSLLEAAMDPNIGKYSEYSLYYYAEKEIFSHLIYFFICFLLYFLNCRNTPELKINLNFSLAPSPETLAKVIATSLFQIQLFSDINKCSVFSFACQHQENSHTFKHIYCHILCRTVFLFSRFVGGLSRIFLYLKSNKVIFIITYWIIQFP